MRSQLVGLEQRMVLGGPNIREVTMMNVGQETILVTVFVMALVICFLAIKGSKFKLSVRLNQFSMSLN